MTTPFTHLVSEKTTQNNTHPNNAGATYSLTCEWVLWSARRGKGVKILRHTPDAQTERPQYVKKEGGIKRVVKGPPA